MSDREWFDKAREEKIRSIMIERNRALVKAQQLQDELTLALREVEKLRARLEDTRKDRDYWEHHFRNGSA
jgi:hypothetical protein